MGKKEAERYGIEMAERAVRDWIKLNMDELREKWESIRLPNTSATREKNELLHESG